VALAGATAAVLVVVLRRPPAEGMPLAWTDPVRRRWRSARASGRAAWMRWRRGVPSRRDRRAALVALFATVALIAALAGVVARLVPRSGPVPADWQVVACDVGQGDSLVIRSGPASAVVVDTGPDGAAGRCLDTLGVTRVDLLVLSHFHADHVGGLPGVLAGRDVRAAWVSPRSAPAGQARRTLDALDEIGVDAQVPTVGSTGQLADGGWRVTWRVLGTGIGGSGPDASGASEGSDGGDGINDASLGVELVSSSAGGVLDIVALGDLEEPGQDALLAALRAGGPPGVLDGVDVVKVAHHGSASQSRGLAALLSPSIALVSVGAGNTYGHPTDRMLRLYEDVGATVVRTDECGSAVLAVRMGRVGLSCT
jgi:competence protein ComEC